MNGFASCPGIFFNEAEEKSSLLLLLRIFRMYSTSDLANSWSLDVYVSA